MAGEEQIKLNLTVPEDFFSELDRRFEAAAKKASQAFGRAAGGGGIGAGGGGGSAAGGGGGGGGGLPGGGGLASAGTALLDVGKEVLAGAGAGIRGVKGAATGSTQVMADAAITGGLSSFVEGTVGKIPILGDWIVAQMNAAKDAIEIPRDRATSRLAGRFANLAKAGYNASDDEIRKGLEFQNKIEQRGYEAEQRVDRMNREMHPTSAAFGITWNGSG